MTMYAGDEFYDTAELERSESECPGCNGSGWDVMPDHAPTCDGNCTGACPVPVQVPCPSCGGFGVVPA